MLRLRLQPHVSFAIVEERAVFLDLRRDRYFTLEAESARAFARLRGNPLAPLDRGTSERLLATGLFTTARGPGQFAAVEAPRAAGMLRYDMRAPVHFGELAGTWLALGRARRALRSTPLETIIGKCRQCHAVGATRRLREDTLALAGRFRRARALVPIKPGCLQDSLALSDWLARRGAFPSLIFGVKLNPFAAHCWVQFGQTVLNDAPDIVEAFTPILKVA